MPENARWRLANFLLPQDGELVEVDRHQAVGALQADENAAGIRRIGEMARHRGDREALHELHAAGVVDINLIAREAVDHEESPVRAEAQLVWIGHRQALLHGTGCRIEEQHLVADRVTDQQALAVGAERDVVRLAQHRDAAQLLLARHVDQADRRAAGVDHEGEARRMAECRTDTEQRQEIENGAGQSHAARLRWRCPRATPPWPRSASLSANTAVANAKNTQAVVAISTLSV